jgi:hypothetical protein
MYMIGEMTYSDGRKVIHREMTDDEVKCMFNNIRLNTGFSFPDQLIQDFMDGDIVPTFKKCLHFNREDFRTLVHPILKKRERKRLPKPSTQRKSRTSRGNASKPKQKLRPKQNPISKPRQKQKTGKRKRTTEVKLNPK